MNLHSLSVVSPTCSPLARHPICLFIWHTVQVIKLYYIHLSLYLLSLFTQHAYMLIVFSSTRLLPHLDSKSWVCGHHGHRAGTREKHIPQQTKPQPLQHWWQRSPNCTRSNPTPSSSNSTLKGITSPAWAFIVSSSVSTIQPPCKLGLGNWQ